MVQSLDTVTLACVTLSLFSRPSLRVSYRPVERHPSTWVQTWDAKYYVVPRTDGPTLHLLDTGYKFRLLILLHRPVELQDSCPG